MEEATDLVWIAEPSRAVDVVCRGSASSCADVDDHEDDEGGDDCIAQSVVHVRGGRLELVVVVPGHFGKSKEMTTLNERNKEGRKEKSCRTESLLAPSAAPTSEDMRRIFRQPSGTVPQRLAGISTFALVGVFLGGNRSGRNDKFLNAFKIAPP